MAASKLVIEKATVADRSKDGQAVLACGGIDFSVGDGSFVGIVGPSGRGKATLLYAIDGLVPLYPGRIKIEFPKRMPGHTCPSGAWFEISA